MKVLMHKKFFKTNTTRGIERYLSANGFDLGLGYDFVPGPTKDYVYAVAKDETDMDHSEHGVWVEPVKPDDGTDDLLVFINDVGGMPKYIAELLVSEGYDTVTKVRQASDEELLAIAGIAKGRLRAIRKVTNGS